MSSTREGMSENLPNDTNPIINDTGYIGNNRMIPWSLLKVSGENKPLSWVSNVSSGIPLEVESIQCNNPVKRDFSNTSILIG